jgi:hypothetical protein
MYWDLIIINTRSFVICFDIIIAQCINDFQDAMSNAFKLLIFKKSYLFVQVVDPTIGCSKMNKQSSSMHKNMVEIIDGGARCLLNYLIELKLQT